MNISHNMYSIILFNSCVQNEINFLIDIIGCCFRILPHTNLWYVSIISRTYLKTVKLLDVLGLDLLCSGYGKCNEFCGEKYFTITSDDCTGNLKCCTPKYLP